MLTNGRKLDNRYLVEKEIGSGGFGAVYLAEDTRFTGNNRVAIKKIALNNEQSAKAFHHEANLLYNLNHPNLPKVTNCFQEEDANFIVMDFIAGEDLMARLKKGKTFSIEEVLEIADKVLDALEYLHSFLIFHRDIKPHNIKINPNGKIFLLDFGTAKGHLEETTLSLTDLSVTGYTPFYAPLEQILRADAHSYLSLQIIDSPHLDNFMRNKTDARSDIYSLGATVYHLLTGIAPERGAATLRAHSLWSGKPDSLPDCRKYNEEISAPLAAIINQCLDIDPEKRFQTAAELRAALNDLQTGESDRKTQRFNAKAELPTQKIISSTEPLPTQPASTIPSNFSTEKSLSASEIFLKPNNSPKSNRKIGLYLGLFGLFLVLTLAVGGLAWLKFGATSEQIAQTPPSAANSRVLSYSLLVQKMRDGKKFQEAFASSGQEIFENGYQFQMSFTPPDAGYLYVFAEGLDRKNEKIFNLLFPFTVEQNGGKAEVSANTSYTTGWNQFGGKADTENFWIVWSKGLPEIAESARANCFKSGDGKLTDGDLQKKLKNYLESARVQNAQTTKDAEKKATKINFEGDSIVYLLQLEHR